MLGINNVLIISIFSILALACNSEVSFDENPGAATIGQGGSIDFTGGDGEGETTSENGKVITQSFQRQSRPLDIVWGIDNSGSMDYESEHIRQNFSNFLASTGQRSDIKLLLLTHTYTAQANSQDPNRNGRNGVTLPAGLNPDRYFQHSQFVGSHDALADTYNALAGPYSNFFRPNSEKAFIFVTDDEAENVGALEFQQGLENLFPGISYRTYNFITVNKATTRCGVNTGAEYIDLQKTMGGEIYDVCETDWSEALASLSKDLVAQANSSFNLSKTPIKDGIISVRVNGRRIPMDAFLQEGARVIIDDEYLQGHTNFNIQIEYRVLK